MDELTGARHETAKRDKIIAERERVNRMDQDACIALAEIGSLTAADSLEDYVSRAEVLLEFSVTLAEQLRPYDRLLRIYNDMFLVSLPYTDVDVAKIVMDRLHEKVTGGSLAFDGGTHNNPGSPFRHFAGRWRRGSGTILDHAHEAMDIAKYNALANIFMWERK